LQGYIPRLHKHLVVTFCKVTTRPFAKSTKLTNNTTPCCNLLQGYNKTFCNVFLQGL
jgi:hypothetical protein